MASREPSRKPTAPQRDQKRGGAALLIIDMSNLFNFVGGDKLRTAANRMITPVQRLRSQADASKVPVIYVNDNFGEWHSDQSRLVNRARSEASEIIDALAPREQDYFIIKPQLSGFYATNLPLLLPKFGVSRLVLTGSPLISVSCSRPAMRICGTTRYGCLKMRLRPKRAIAQSGRFRSCTIAWARKSRRPIPSI